MGEFNRLYGSKQIFVTAANEYTIIPTPFLSDRLEKYWAEGTQNHRYIAYRITWVDRQIL